MPDFLDEWFAQIAEKKEFCLALCRRTGNTGLAEMLETVWVDLDELLVLKKEFEDCEDPAEKEVLRQKLVEKIDLCQGLVGRNKGILESLGRNTN